MPPPIRGHWFVAARAMAVGRVPIRTFMFGAPVVLVRGGSGNILALEDRCPDRGVPLSAGRLEGNSLVCRYHGWAFGVDGHCTTMPETPDGSPLESVRVPAYFVLERDVLSLGD